MRSLFYFTFGIIIMLFVFTALFNTYAVEYLDDYYVDLLYSTYLNDWKMINTIVAAIFILYVLTFAFMLGKGVKNNEPLFIDKNE